MSFRSVACCLSTVNISLCQNANFYARLGILCTGLAWNNGAYPGLMHKTGTTCSLNFFHTICLRSTSITDSTTCLHGQCCFENRNVGYNWAGWGLDGLCLQVCTKSALSSFMLNAIQYSAVCHSASILVYIVGSCMCCSWCMRKDGLHFTPKVYTEWRALR